MELNDANLQSLTEFLRKTLDPDPTVRRPGNTIYAYSINLHILMQLIKIYFVRIDLFVPTSSLDCVISALQRLLCLSFLS